MKILSLSKATLPVISFQPLLFRPGALGIVSLGFCCSLAFAEPGITSSMIIIGQSAAFTGSPAQEVKQTTAGAQLYFDQINKSGGIGGRKIKLESLDDGFDPKRTVANTKILLGEKNAFALFLYRGTPTTEAALPIINEAKVPLIAPVTGAASMHEPISRYVFNVRSKYRDEISVAVRQLSSMGIKKIAVLASNDSFGDDALTGLKTAVQEHRLPAPTIARYKRNTVAIDDAVKIIAAAQPQAVMMFCTATPCAAFIREYRKQGGFQPLFTLSNVSSKAFIKSLGDDARGLGMTQVFPNVNNTTIPVIKEFRALVRNNPELVDSFPALEGFISAKVLVEGLHNLGANPTREKLISSLESIKNLDIGGFLLSYSPTNHTGSNYVDVTVLGKDGIVLH